MFSNAIKGKRTESSFQSPHQPGFSRLNPVIVTGLCSEEQSSCLNLPQRPQSFSGANWVGLTRYRDDEEGGGPRILGENAKNLCRQTANRVFQHKDLQKVAQNDLKVLDNAVLYIFKEQLSEKPSKFVNMTQHGSPSNATI